MKLNPLQNDRAAGVLVAMAAGDALGAGYEFGAPLPDGAEVTMKGGGPFGFAPAEWTDDTSMAIPIAQALLETTSRTGSSSPAALTMIVRSWTSWAASAKDVGAQTRSVIAAARGLATAAGRSKVRAADFTAAAADFHTRTGRSAGNGSLMRTAPLALAYLDREPGELMAAAGVISALTHAAPDAQEACGLWCVAIRNAVLTGTLDVRAGLTLLPEERAVVWLGRIDIAERSRPRDFTNNGWVVEAFQGAWSAIHYAGLTASGPARLRAGLEEAVRGGRDTDTVAAIAGGLLGATHGYTAVPVQWRRNLHGWPGMRARDLMTLGMELGRGQGHRPNSWPRAEHHDYSMWSRTDVLVQDPHDAGVWLGGVGALGRVAELGIEAVVSLCRLGTTDSPPVALADHATFWIVDSANPDDNAHPEFALTDAAAAVEQFRSEGKKVLLHCVRAESRTPTVAALHGARHAQISPLAVLQEIQRALPVAHPNAMFMDLLASTEDRCSPSRPRGPEQDHQAMSEPAERNMSMTQTAELSREQRDTSMVARYADGETLDAIGQSFGLTRERVRQIITKVGGTNAEESRRKRMATRETDVKSANETFLAEYGDLSHQMAKKGITRQEAIHKLQAL